MPELIYESGRHSTARSQTCSTRSPTAGPARSSRLPGLEALKTRLGDLPPPAAAAIPVLPSNLAASYTARVRDLHAAALPDRDHPEALEAARSLIEMVIVYPPETHNDPPRVELVRDVIALLQAGGLIAPQSESLVSKA